MPDDNIADIVPEEFWAIVEDARQDPQRFRQALANMSREDLIRFCWTYEELASRLRTERHLPFVQQDLSEDGVAELANWVVAQGKRYYRTILHHPEKIPPKKNDAGFLSELVEEYEERYHDGIPPNVYQWDDEWRAHNKSSPWS